jgi:hypothetical protein
MNKKLMVLCLFSFLSVSVFAEEKHVDGHPCKQIKSACEAAGFIKGGHKDKKGLHLDCMKPILDGQAVAGVSVSAEQISACKIKQAEHKAKKDAKK